MENSRIAASSSVASEVEIEAMVAFLNLSEVDCRGTLAGSTRKTRRPRKSSAARINPKIWRS
jgi:hypothetical protein